MRFRILSVTLLSFIILAGCETPTKRQSGTVIGGIAGGILGNQVGKGDGRTAAIIIGTIAGAFIGGAIGQEMDDNDHYRSQQALESTPTNQYSSWKNPDTGNSYTVTPTKTYQAASGPCREYTTDAIIDGRRETVYGTACRQADGSWQAAN